VIGELVEPPGPSLGERLLGFIRDFGPDERNEAFEAVADGVAFVVREGFGVGRPRRSFPPPLLVLVVAAAGTFLLVRLGRLRLGRRSRPVAGPGGTRESPQPETPFYEEAVRALARAGVVRRPWQSPREFLATALTAKGERAHPFRGITREFETVRYGHRPLAPDREAAVRAEVSRLAERLSDLGD
jgi:hypothetical protein